MSPLAGYPLWSRSSTQMSSEESVLWPLTEWWLNRHSRSMVRAGLLGAHHYYSLTPGRPPVVNLYEVPGMSVYTAELHQASLDDFPHLPGMGQGENYDKYVNPTEEDLAAIRNSGSSAAIYELRAMYPPLDPQPKDDGSGATIRAALRAPCVTLFSFVHPDDQAVADWFAGALRREARPEYGPLLDARLLHYNPEQHPSTPLPIDGREWLVVVQWPTLAAGEAAIAHLRSELDTFLGAHRDTCVQDLCSLKGSHLNDKGWQH